jgi:hypothetical protein
MILETIIDEDSYVFKSTYIIYKLVIAIKLEFILQIV